MDATAFPLSPVAGNGRTTSRTGWSEAKEGLLQEEACLGDLYSDAGSNRGFYRGIGEEWYVHVIVKVYAPRANYNGFFAI